MRAYSTKPKIYIDNVTQHVIQPDEQLINTFHKLLELIPDDNHALSIDHCVSELLRFHNPNIPGDMTPPELIEFRKLHHG